MIDNLVYNLFLKKLTPKSYTEFFQRLPKGARILDIGVGNGLMIKENHQLIKDKNLHIHGLDFNEKYLKQCNKLIKKHGLVDNMVVEKRDFLVWDLQPGCFDAVFFSQSFPLIDEKQQALDKAREVLKPGGRVYFCHTIVTETKPFLEFIKPKLKFFSTIDFGRVTYAQDFADCLKEGRFQELERKHLLKVSKDAHAHLIVAKPV